MGREFGHAVEYGENALEQGAVGWRDLAGSIRRLPLAAWLALDDIHGKYRRTVLGPLWIVIGQGAMILGFAIVFSGLFRMDPATYLLYLAAGFPVWTLIAQFLTEMPVAFIGAKGIIESYELPWITHIWRRSFAYLLTFFHHILILFLAIAVMSVLFWQGAIENPPNIADYANMLYVIPGLLLVLIAGTGTGLLIAVIGARYRDLQPAMQVASSFLMLLSPVVWRADHLQLNTWIVELNPVYYYLRVVRDPLLGLMPPTQVWFVASVLAVGLFVLGFLAFLFSRRRLYHWL